MKDNRAREKAGAGLLQVVAVPDAWVIGADTEVILGDEVFGKPVDEADAAAMAAYLAEPLDGVAPAAITAALAALSRGELLSPASTQRLVGLMAQARTGPRRLKGGLPAGWSIAHKTGTGQDFQGASVGINDVGLLTAAPDIGADLTDLFNSLTGYSRKVSYRNLLVAPHGVRRGIIERIERLEQMAGQRIRMPQRFDGPYRPGPHQG